MGAFTVCSELVSHCGQREYYFINILTLFTLAVPLKICIDATGHALRLYRDVAENDYRIAEWIIKLVRMKGKNAFREITIPNKNWSSTQLFVEICANTAAGSRTLFCVVPEKYNDTSWELRGIELLDKDEAIVRLIQTIACLKQSHGVKKVFENINGSVVVTDSTIIFRAQGGFRMVDSKYRNVKDSTIIDNSTIINRSILHQAMNRIASSDNEELASALKYVAEIVAGEANPVAGEIFDAFNEELAKPKPRKQVLKGLWENLTRLIPTILAAGEVVARITKLCLTSTP